MVVVVVVVVVVEGCAVDNGVGGAVWAARSIDCTLSASRAFAAGSHRRRKAHQVLNCWLCVTRHEEERLFQSIRSTVRKQNVGR